MEVILGILLILAILVPLATWISNKFSGNRKDSEPEEGVNLQIPNDCCGAHEVCEFEEMLQKPEDIVYFEDEELDRFQGIPAN